MNMRARRMTFCDTCVMERIVVTHFRNPVVGVASVGSGALGIGGGRLVSSTKDRSLEPSNQNKQVIYWNVSRHSGMAIKKNKKK